MHSHLKTISSTEAGNERSAPLAGNSTAKDSRVSFWEHPPMWMRTNWDSSPSHHSHWCDHVSGGYGRTANICGTCEEEQVHCSKKCYTVIHFFPIESTQMMETSKLLATFFHLSGCIHFIQWNGYGIPSKKNPGSYHLQNLKKETRHRHQRLTLGTLVLDKP